MSDRDAGIKILATKMDDEMDGFATGLSLCLLKDGQQTATANQPMNGFRHTNIGEGTARNHYVAISQVQDGKTTYLGNVSVSGNVIFASANPSITAYAAGQSFRFQMPAATPTSGAQININSVGLANVFLDGAIAASGKLPASTDWDLFHDGTQFYATQIGVPRGGQAVGNRTIYTSGGTFAKASLPAYVTHVTAHVWGGGGGGGAGNTGTPSRGYPGAGGGYSRERIPVTALAASETVTVGAAGTGGATSGTSGTTGGTSSFGSHCSATGGAGGIAGQASVGASASAQGGVGSGGDLDLGGEDGGEPFSLTVGAAKSGAAPFLGGSVARINSDARSPGAGGGPGNHSGSPAAGDGGKGLVIVEW